VTDPEVSTSVRPVRTPRGRRWLWIAGVVTAGAVIVVAAITLTGAPAVPDGGPHGRAQAAAIDALLDSSTTGRGYLLTAIDDINRCAATTLTGSTLSYIRSARTARQNLLAAVEQTVVSDLPDGNEIKTELTTAVQASYDTDKAYLDWVLASSDNCPTHADPAWAPVAAANATADRAKQTFVGHWNPVAGKYGLPQRSLTVI
jgi:hypothetical protein